MIRSAGTAVFLALVLGVSLAEGGERKHVVQAGESASAIAERVYGDRTLGRLLLAYNGRSGTVIRPGETLRVPVCDVHRVRPGDSWSALTKRYLGNASAWRLVAQLNGMVPSEPLRVGQDLVFPVVIDERLERGATLAILAERYYGDPRRGRLLQEFNGLDDPRRLAVGATIRVPLVSLRPRAEAPAVAEVARTAPRATPSSTPEPEAPVVSTEIAEATPQPTAIPSPVPTPTPAPAEPVALFALDLATAKTAFERAEFESAMELLEELREPVTLLGSNAERQELLRLLAFVYVAFDDAEEACAAYGALTRFAGEPELDPDVVSPKIRKLLSSCVSPA